MSGHRIALTCDQESPSPSDWDTIGRAMIPEFQFLACHWLEPWGRRLLEPSGWQHPLDYVVARNDLGKIVGAIPFATRTKARTEVLALAGSFVPFRGFPVAKHAAPAVAEGLARYLTEHHRATPLRLAPVAKQDPVLDPLLENLRGHGWRVHEAHNGFRQIIRLPDSFEQYVEERRGSRWKKLGKLDRRMRREHDVKLELFTSETCEDWNAVIRDLGEIEDKSWLPKHGGDLKFSGRDNENFWSEVLHARRRGLAARVWVLYFGNRPVTFDFNLDSGTCRYSISGHYIEEVGSFSPGAILFRGVVKDAIKRGIKIIDMGGGDSGYKGYWGAKPAEPIIDCTIFPPGLKGGMMSAAVKFSDWAGRLRQRTARTQRSQDRAAENQA